MTVPGASRLLRRPAAVIVVFGLVSSAGVLRVAAAGVTDVLLLALVEAVLLGSTEAAADRLDGGLDTGGLASAFPAVDGTRWTPVGRVADPCGAGVDDSAFGGALMLSLSGILIVPALCVTGSCDAVDVGTDTGAGNEVGICAGAGVGVRIGAGAGVATGTGAGNNGTGSAGAIGTGLGKSFCFFFCCISGSMEGEAEVASSNFLFLDGFLSPLGV